MQSNDCWGLKRKTTAIVFSIWMKADTKGHGTFTQCTDMQNAIAFALILPGKISDRRRPGTGPAPRENAKTTLRRKVLLYNDKSTKIHSSLNLLSRKILTSACLQLTSTSIASLMQKNLPQLLVYPSQLPRTNVWSIGQGHLSRGMELLLWTSRKQKFKMYAHT